MTISQTLTLLDEVRKLGYHFYLNGEKLQYRYMAKIGPLKEKVEPLLTQARQNRQDIISYLQTSLILDHLLIRANNHIDESYLEGCAEWAETIHHPLFDPAKNLNTAWINYLKIGQHPVGGWEAAVELYIKEWLQIIQDFCTQHQEMGG